jgi:hypothetical protein
MPSTDPTPDTPMFDEPSSGSKQHAYVPSPRWIGSVSSSETSHATSGRRSALTKTLFAASSSFAVISPCTFTASVEPIRSRSGAVSSRSRNCALASPNRCRIAATDAGNCPRTTLPRSDAAV